MLRTRFVLRVTQVSTNTENKNLCSKLRVLSFPLPFSLSHPRSKKVDAWFYHSAEICAPVKWIIERMNELKKEPRKNSWYSVNRNLFFKIRTDIRRCTLSFSCKILAIFFAAGCLAVWVKVIKLSYGYNYFFLSFL